MTATTPPDVWYKAYVGLLEDLEKWRPNGFDAIWGGLRDGHPGLILTRNEKTITVANMSWAGYDLPAQIAVSSNMGTRIRLAGPGPSGEWDIYTSDFVKMRVPWREDDVRTLLGDLVSL